MYPRNFVSYKIVRTYVRLPLHVTGGESLHFKHPARFGGKRARIKITEANFFGRKTWKFDSGGEKMRNASGHQGENELQWKRSEQEHIHFLRKTCNREVCGIFIVVVVQNNGKCRKKCAARAKLIFLWLIRQIVVVGCPHRFLNVTRYYIYIFFFWVNYKY